MPEEFILITNLLYNEVKHDINNIFPLKFKKNDFLKVPAVLLIILIVFIV